MFGFSFRNSNYKTLQHLMENISAYIVAGGKVQEWVLIKACYF